MTERNGRSPEGSDLAAGAGLIHRRTLLRGGALAAGLGAAARAQAEGIGAGTPPTMKIPGAPFSPYGSPSPRRAEVKRILGAPPRWAGTGSSRTPLEALEGTITPSGLHFERHHNGVPDIDPARHRLLIHGLVRRPLTFDLESLLQYPLETHAHFIECAGNSGAQAGAQPPAGGAGLIHGLLSCSEWTGVKLSHLLDEAGVEPGARWLIAEGADAAGMSRSVPLWKAQDDAMVALYQNGEAIRPEQGFPMRLLLPGFEGNANVKWLHRLKLVEGPVNSKDETSRYSELLPDGRARQFMLEMGVKSVITRPSPGVGMTRGAGIYEISGLAWSGAGRVRRVEVSADGGKSWAEAALTGPVLPKAVTRFRLPWRWEGAPAVLMSRATDERGERQPTHAAWIAQYAPGQNYHYNAIQPWAVDGMGSVRNLHA